jgi:hypothetical protein
MLHCVCIRLHDTRPSPPPLVPSVSRPARSVSKGNWTLETQLEEVGSSAGSGPSATTSPGVQMLTEVSASTGAQRRNHRGWVSADDE